MLFWTIASSFCTLLQIVQGSSHGLWDLDSGSLIHSPATFLTATHDGSQSLRGNRGREEATRQSDLHRQRRQAVSFDASPVEYTVAVEILFADSSLQNTIKSYLNNLSFPLLINASDPAGNISSLQVTTVCNSTGSNGNHCYCEDGYWWPNDVCHNPAHPGITAATEEYHNCIAQLPSQGIYCQLLPEDTGVIYVINMTVRLNIPFQNDLKNPSSTLYKQYKRDLERAFTVGYQTLRGFISAKVTGFRNGSTVVNYEVTSARAIPVENAGGRVAEALNSSYKVDPTSFRSSTVEIYGGTNISISPKPIFKGDTVTMTCESRSKSSNVTWSFRGSPISSSDRLSITSAHTNGKAVSMLKIRNILQNESGQYSCTFTDQETSPTTMHTAEDNITVSLIQIVKSEDIVMECNGEPRELSCCVDMEMSFFNVHWKPDGAINISGTNDSILNCTRYELQANESQCPADKSGTVTTYTCELSTGDGARQSKQISVKYLRKAKVTLVSSTNGQVSERANFSLTCRSDVSNYDKISWAIQNGHLVTVIDSMWYTSTKTQNGAESVLDVRSASQNWTGTYTCSFSQVSLNSSAHLAMEVFPLPLQQDIVRDPIEAIIPCPGNQVLKCCIPRGRMENYTVTFKVDQRPSSFRDGKREEGDSVCDIRTLRYDNCNHTGEAFSATCKFRNQIGGSVQSSPMKLKLESTKVTLVSSAKGQVSEGGNFSLTCRSEFSNYDKVRWEIQNGNLVQDIDNVWYTMTKSQNGTESVLDVHRANQNWGGTYTCTFSQESLNSSAHLAMKVVPLPLQQDIVRDPIEAIIPCPGNQVLKCCIPRGRMENYTVTFKVDQRPSSFRDVERQEGIFSCHIRILRYDNCDHAGQAFSASCEFGNQIGGRVQSSPMSLNLAPKKTITCNSSDIGAGETGAEVVKPCLGSDSSVRGDITYKCDRVWVMVRNSCLSSTVNNLVLSAESLVYSPVPIQALPTYLSNLSNTVKTEEKDISSSSANLEAVVGILNTISVIPVDAEKETVANFLSTVDTVIGAPTDTWNDVTNGSSQLLDSVEQFSNSLLAVNGRIPSVSLENIQLQGLVLNKNNISDYNKDFIFSSLSNLSSNVLIDKEEIGKFFQSTIISVAYSNLSHIIPQDKQSEELINGLVISTVVKANQSENFQIKMTFAKMNKSLIKPRCVFWNFSFFGDRGGWDETGCERKENEENVSCSCNHLTSFSVLMSPAGRDKSHWQALSYITYIGVGISLLSLVACIVIEALVWKSVTKTRISYMRHVCILNVAISLLIADIWFIVIATKEDKLEKKICTAVAFFTHFFYLCVFFWMLSLSLMLFYHLVFILHNTSKTTMKAVAFCLGYGCPLVISGITIAVTLPQGSYMREDLCFLNWKDSYALLAMVVPALTIVAINAMITIVVIAKIPIRSIGERSRNDERSSLYRITKSIGVLTPLLGLTWGFGLATVFEGSSIVFHILFNFFNAFQGLFILLFGILWDRKVREALLNKFSLSRWSSQTSKSTAHGPSAPMLSISSPFSRALNNLFGKAGKYQVSSMESASSSSENTSKAYSLLT